MRAILLIARKDFKQTVTSPLFFFISALCTIVWSLMYLSFLRSFAAQGFMAQMQGGGAGHQSLMSTVFVQHISVINLVLIFTVPALTMRLISEEKKSRSYDLLLTSPISSTEIAIGKFLAGLGATTLLLGLSFLYPAGTALIAKFNWATLLVLYFGVFLITALYTASGLFASSLTESAMLAVFMGVVFNLMIWFLGQSGAGSDIKWWAEVSEYLSVGSHLTGFLKGALRISSIVFFTSAIGFFVFLCQRVIESSRWR
jgi:ABC-2 type transport system permease protein